MLDLPSLIAGDFNYIIRSHEKMGGRHYDDSIDFREFRRFIDDLGLIDLGYTGLRFTWYNNWIGMARVWERIDQALATTDWFQCFPRYKVQYLPRITSEHCLLLITIDGPHLLRMSFRFKKF